MAKIIIAIIFFLVGLVVFIMSQISNMASRNSGKKIVRKCKESVDFVKKLAEKLDFFYEKRDFNEPIFNKKIATITENFQLDDHLILLTNKLDSNKYLLVTYCSEMDFNITLGGKVGDIPKLRHYNFVLLIDRSKNLLKVYSDMYSDNDDKNLRDNFLRKLFKYLLE